MKDKLPYMISGAIVFAFLGVIYNTLMIVLGWGGLFLVAALGALVGLRFRSKQTIEQFSKDTEGFDWDDKHIH